MGSTEEKKKRLQPSHRQRLIDAPDGSFALWHLYERSDWGHNGIHLHSSGEINRLGAKLAVHTLGGAVAGDVSGFSALVTGLAGSIERASIWRSAIS